MAEVADAYVSLLPSAKGWGTKVEREVGPELEKAGKSTGSRLSTTIGSVLKKGLKAGGLAVGGVLGAALFKGFSRLSAIDEAKAKLAGLGNSAKTVDTIMKNALTSVKGTAFGLGDAATIAASAVAAGIKPGQQLTKYLRLTADAASITGDSLSDMGASLNNVQTLGAAYNDTLQIFAQKGIPVYSLLSKKLGVSAAEVKNLASEGKISADVFNTVLTDAVGGSALKAGNTFRGALANMGAALGRFGAALLTGVFPIAKQVFGSITRFLDTMTAKVGPLADSFSAKLPGAFAAVAGALKGIDFGAIAAKLAPLVSAFQSFAGHVISAGTKIGPVLLSIARGLAPIAKAAIVAAVVGLTAAFTVLGPVIDGLASAFASTAKFVKSNQTTFKVLGGIIGAILLPVLIQTTVALIAGRAAWALNAAQMAVATVWIRAYQLAAKVATAAQWLWNAAVNANPLGLLIIGLIAVGAGLVLLWKKSETFRTIVTGAFRAVQAAVGFVVDFIKAHWPLLLAILTGPIGAAVILVVKNFDKIKSAGTSVVNWVKGIPGKLAGLAGKFGNAGKTLIHAFINGLSKAGGVAANFASGIWNAVKSAINAGIDRLNSLLEFTIDPPGPGPKIHINPPNIGHLAAGTNFWRGGPSWVGENGPEILNIPRGSQVIPNHKIGALSTGGVGGTEVVLAHRSVQELGDYILAGARDASAAQLSVVQRSAAGTRQTAGVRR
jgi:tape measure domain-containing protein